MAEPLGGVDRAKIVAASLRIRASSFAGDEANALVAMTLIASYPRFSPQDQRKVLPAIQKLFPDNQVFFQQCQNALADINLNPDWVPGSMSDKEVAAEAEFWTNVQTGLAYFNAKPLGAYFPPNASNVLDALKEGGANVGKTAAELAVINRLAGLRGRAMIPGRTGTVGLFVYLTTAATIADSAIKDMTAEQQRRGQLRTLP